ncbi:hypothetical protein GNI_043320 [Gregarina niphandrodes]|uniref:Uncharacterized protein n=1 Tax=Gregarina niphandrodes TaxID=110365 RepID=A0A023B9Z2_GRENI|nr:hypothetical protein GNI_043320 [Gregarina niphandrodes]EZG77009.1 hypothetical protein GNI_043320 [Gregarina niphandrodes]|eukprot:XP_011129536.1 hypothetical protein GNI_043320 [Gregarina niphandrodes]
MKLQGLSTPPPPAKTPTPGGKPPSPTGVLKFQANTKNQTTTVLENVVSELERKARYYWLLFNREKRKKGDLQNQNYYLLHENLKLNEHVRDEGAKLSILETKLNEIRADPATLKAIFERVQLLYYQFDTLTQSLAGVCGTLAFAPPDTGEEKIKCMLDYLYPCRALDPRLDGLFGAMLEIAAGIRQMPKDVQIPPPPGFSALVKEGAYPWSVGGDAPIYIRNLFQPDASGSQLLKAQMLAKEYLAREVDRKQGDESVVLKGFILEFGEITLHDHKYRTPSGKLVVVCRFDNEATNEMNKIAPPFVNE